MARQRDYKAEYAARVARGQAAGLSRSQARGHPSAVKREPLVTQLPPAQRPPKTPRAPKPLTPFQRIKHAKSGGKNSNITKKNKAGEKTTKAVKFSGKRATNLANTAGRIDLADPNARVMLNVKDADGNWHTIYSKGGRKAGDIAAAIAASGGSASSWLESEIATVYEEDSGGFFDMWGDGDIDWELVAFDEF